MNINSDTHNNAPKKEKPMTVKTPIFPTYLRAQELIRILENKSETQFKEMHKAILSLSGTPQEPVDWSNPDQWIPQRLSGKDRETQNTFYHRKNKDKGYHTDYAFVSENLFENSTLTIGDINAWIGKSDHVPVIFTING
ncbi:MAG: hypothetical protein GY757_36250 [bacterium]|nr:hypothetical protein [bacterium]